MDTSVHQIKSRTAALGLRSVDVILALRERGINTSAPQYSAYLSSALITPKALEVMSAANEYLKELEGEKK